MRKLNIAIQREPKVGDVVRYNNESFKSLYGYKALIVSVKHNLVETLDDKGKSNHFLWRTSEGVTDQWTILNLDKVKDFKENCIKQLEKSIY